MKLLAPTSPPELPTDALLARLRSRRAKINLQADSGEPATGDVTRWVYRHLNSRLRKRLEPFLELLAIRDLTLSLRYALSGESPPAVVLDNSLLAEPIKNIVLNNEDEDTVAQLEGALSRDYPFINTLTKTYVLQGPGGVEQQLAAGSLRHALERSMGVFLKKTFSYLIDTRNCLLIQKYWRWQVEQSPPLVAGGTLDLSGLQRIWSAHDSSRLELWAAQLAGRPLHKADPIGMEQGLLTGMTRFLKRSGRDPLSMAVVIEYLWLNHLATHNQLLRSTLLPDREKLLEETLLL